MTENDAPRARVWAPERGRCLGATVEEVVEAFSLLLEVRYSDHHKPFRDRHADPASATLRAAWNISGSTRPDGAI